MEVQLFQLSASCLLRFYLFFRYVYGSRRDVCALFSELSRSSVIELYSLAISSPSTPDLAMEKFNPLETHQTIFILCFLSIFCIILINATALAVALPVMRSLHPD